MESPPSYCSYVADLAESNVHKAYHDYEYGFPLEDDDQLFGRLILEINQAGLSWTTILNKKENFNLAYSHFNIREVANYKNSDIERLLSDSGIIRNRLKINAAIHNAKVILSLQKEFGSFKKWIEHHHPMEKDEWVKLFKKTFKFTGGEIVNEFLTSTGYLEGAHVKTCPVYSRWIKENPPFLRS